MPSRVSAPRRWFSLVAAVATSALFDGSAPASAAKIVDVRITDFDFTDSAGRHFDPVIERGDAVRWFFDFGHHGTTSVVGIAESWDSGLHFATFPVLTFDHTFTNLGAFAYFCRAHGFDRFNGTAGGMSGVVTVVERPPVAGDFNGDRRVDALDLATWQAAFGGGGADADGDNDSDGDDMLVWQRQLGQTSMTTTPIPEPCGATPAACAAAWGLLIFRSLGTQRGAQFA